MEISPYFFNNSHYSKSTEMSPPPLLTNLIKIRLVQYDVIYKKKIIKIRLPEIKLGTLN